jgi:serine/threonine-protein kinase
MPITSGVRVGPYDVLEPLGRGGMGEVFRARDNRLQRDVALKVIHPELAGEEYVARFRREARTLATLSHPHIASLYELDEVDGTSFLVMELVAGPTLADRLASGALPMSEAIRMAAQVAAALEAVHEKGIIHRDLKPANVKLTEDGTVKVLDFGLAKTGAAQRAALSHLATSSFSGTQDGLVVGTAAYMSPEQARGAEVDRRTDVWSFGCVLYEMLTGRAAFARGTFADTLGAVMARDPDWTALPRETPPAVVRILRRCLQRDRARRLRDMGDARIELEDAELARDVSVPAASSEVRPALIAIAGIAGGLLLGALAARAPRGDVPPAASRARFAITVPTTAPLGGLDFPSVAIAPDGSHFVYVGTRGGQTQLFARQMNELELTPLAGTLNAVAPFFSPDGAWIAFFADGQLRKVPASGGTPVTISDAPAGMGGSWSASGLILFAAATGSGISVVPESGGAPRQVTTLDIEKGEFSHRWPEWLPGGRTFLYTVGTAGSWNDAQIVAQTTAGERTLLVSGGTNPRYISTGHLTYAQNGRIMLAPFDVGSLAIRGTPAPLLENVMQSSDGAAQFALSRAGPAVYVEGTLDPGLRRLVSVARDGTATPFAAPPGPYATPRVSPDGQRILLTMETSPSDLWTYEIPTGASRQLTFNAGATSPAWSRDGRRIAFTSTRSGVPNVFVADAPQLNAGERVAPSQHAQIPGSWGEADGVLAYVERRPASARDILLLPFRETRVPIGLLTSAADESAPRISPDGLRMAYVVTDTRGSHVYLRALAGSAAATQVSSEGGTEPVWAPSGRELFYRDGDRMMAVSLDDSGVSRPRILFEGSFARGTIESSNYDVMPDGQRLVMLQRPAQDGSEATLHVVLGWMESLGTASSP